MIIQTVIHQNHIQYQLFIHSLLVNIIVECHKMMDAKQCYNIPLNCLMIVFMGIKNMQENELASQRMCDVQGMGMGLSLRG